MNTNRNSVLIASDYEKTATIHHIKRKKGQILSKWKVFPKKDMKDSFVDYVYCFLTTKEGYHCFIVKQKCYGEDLYLINAAKFRETCPNNYEIFRDNVATYNSMLAELEATVDQQKTRIERCHDYEILQPYKTNSYVDISKLPASEDARKTALEIRRLFFLELEVEMAKFMRTNINAEIGLKNFVLNFYENRDRSYSIITKEDVLEMFGNLYEDIIDQS